MLWKHFQVVINQIQTGFARALRHTGANAHHIGIGAVGVTALFYFGGRGGVQHAVAQVAHFGMGAFFVQVNQHQFIAHALIQYGKRIADADCAGADYDNFVSYFAGHAALLNNR